MSLTPPPFDISLLQARRARVLAWMREQGGGLAVIPTGGLRYRNATNPYPFRFDSQFFYLTGFTEPDAWLVLIAQGKDSQGSKGNGANKSNDAGDQSVLFCQEKDPDTEVWDGLRWGPQAAREAFSFDVAHTTQELDAWMAQALPGTKNLFAPLHRSALQQLPAKLQGWLESARQASRGRREVPARWIDLTPAISHMRVVKDASELARMRESARIAALGHCEAMRAVRGVMRKGLSERALEAELLGTFLREGAQGAAYETIVASGPNACILHHRAGGRVIGEGELVLIDAGCELDGYASDITRTFPANGRFSAEQAALYDIVLQAQEAAVAVTRPGQSFNAGHEAAVKVLAQGLLDEKILSGSLDEVLENKHYLPFYMHRTGHWLGLDVHDAGPYRLTDEDSDEPDWRPLVPGMVLTIEPGLYIRPAENVSERFWNIGIRIEDDAVVTDSGCDLITRGVPVDRASIEDLIAQRR